MHDSAGYMYKRKGKQMNLYRWRLLARILIVLSMCGVVGWVLFDCKARRHAIMSWGDVPVEVQSILIESSQLAGRLSEKELLQLIADIQNYSSSLSREENVRTIWRAGLALEIRERLLDGDYDGVNSIVDIELSKFSKAYSYGKFRNTELENISQALYTKAQKQKE